MDVKETPLPGVRLLSPRVHGDSRGFFLESFHAKTFERLGLPQLFVQDNHSRSSRGVTRGLHFQRRHGQGKLVRVVTGSVFDVAVDLRTASPTFGRWFGTILSEGNNLMMYIPEGFAHGFQVISDQADFLYKCTDFYDPEDEGGILWNDPEIAIDWPLREALVSAKDKSYLPLSQTPRDRLPLL
jgi:dTDP-4-dehydrorhamnose 3,5-epimerase